MEIKSVNRNAVADGFAGILYSDSGTGKTTLLDSLPEKKLYIVSIEAGLSVLKKDHDYHETLMPTLKKPNLFIDSIREAYEFLRFQQHSYEYVAIDSTSEMERFLQYSACCLASKTIPTLHHIGTAASLMRKMIMEFRDLKKAANNAVNRPINVILIAGSFPLETLRTDEKVTTRRFPSLTKKFSQEICALVDFVGHMEVNESQNRLLRFHPTSEVMAKTRYSCLKNIVQGQTWINFYNEVVKPIQAEISSRAAPIGGIPSSDPNKKEAGTKPNIISKLKQRGAA